ncbi:hypothetical protein [Vibrio cyclitrophicus]|uniref:hypothetical protein n=1 Tax=Vibrio cyclitrophicus TaxID=47951 RepID=UPI001056AA8A|nr:hypothetical protein [Vibrio cyclitrophicus]
MASVVTFFISRGYTPENHSEILAIASPLATVAAMLFGFIIASVTMFSGSQNELIQNMKDTNKYEPFMSQLHITGLALITSCIFMVLAIFTPNKMLLEDLKISWDYSFLILGFLSLTYGLFEFWFCWKRVNLVSSKM